MDGIERFIGNLLLRGDALAMCGHVLTAWAVGAAIGLERSFHGRPAGFRTHALVCLASALLMLVTVYQGHWISGPQADAFRTDPTRMAQGIMTGIGFLGAGVIFKEGLTVRGLTTAASIWITAALGILFGIGMFLPGLLVSLLTLGTLSLFRRIESVLPVHRYAHLHVHFLPDRVLDEDTLRARLHMFGFHIAHTSYCLTDGGRRFEYHLVLRTMQAENLRHLSDALRREAGVLEFRLAPSSD
ncbi:MgtC/SapB family protein [Plasticicumulans acidivorans]|uniref:Protein MgtC n=1 Tax=Plasticicumulans acidivorans TaxID=886464 RepID=A0A317MZN0_9GAMM|nr:putative Mg2+ transporter-C (MgtC) family protein [Plasticicumulans acidivorans]